MAFILELVVGRRGLNAAAAAAAARSFAKKGLDRIGLDDLTKLCFLRASA